MAPDMHHYTGHMEIQTDDKHKISEDYYKEAREQYIADANNTLTVTTWLVGFLLIWVQITIDRITHTQKWLVVVTLVSLFLSILFSFLVRRRITEFLNDVGNYFEELAEGKSPEEVKTEIDPWQAGASRWTLALGFLLSMVLVVLVLFR